MSDGGRDPGIGFVEFLAQFCSHPLTVTPAPKSLPHHRVLSEQWLPKGFQTTLPPHPPAPGFSVALPEVGTQGLGDTANAMSCPWRRLLLFPAWPWCLRWEGCLDPTCRSLGFQDASVACQPHCWAVQQLSHVPRPVSGQQAVSIELMRVASCCGCGPRAVPTWPVWAGPGGQPQSLAASPCVLQPS